MTSEAIDGENVTTTTYYIGNVEMVSKSNSSVITMRRNLPGAIELRRNNGTKTLNYLHTDHLGSIDTISQANGDIKQKLYFDAWGKKHIINNNSYIDILQGASTLTLSQLLDITPRGFTGHESVDHADIIHMNGRIYDPTLGRFLQADPHIQAPKNSQNLNRYSYVLNNPLSYTDPSGYNFLKKFAGIIVAIVGTYICGPECGKLGYALIGAASGAVHAAVNGGNILQGAFWGAFSSLAFGAIGEHFSKLADANKLKNVADLLENGLTAAQFAKKIFVHAVVGGTMAVMQGGKFGHGFLSAGVTQAAGVAIDGIDKGTRFSASRVVVAAIVGGTVSKLTGGKFANGAITGAFSRAFNDEAHYRSLWNDVTQSLKTLDILTNDKYGFYSEEAVELLMGTAMQESGGFKWRSQLKGGPARGLFQMEQATYDSIYKNFVNYNSDLVKAFDQMFGTNRSFSDIKDNDIYAAAMARMKYYQAPGTIPTTLNGQAAYWKQNYNTPLGKGTVNEYIHNHKRYTP